jgi:hypothetical protein
MSKVTPIPPPSGHEIRVPVGSELKMIHYLHHLQRQPCTLLEMTPWTWQVECVVNAVNSTRQVGKAWIFSSSMQVHWVKKEDLVTWFHPSPASFCFSVLAPEEKCITTVCSVFFDYFLLLWWRTLSIYIQCCHRINTLIFFSGAGS